MLNSTNNMNDIFNLFFSKNHVFPKNEIYIIMILDSNYYTKGCFFGE